MVSNKAMRVTLKADYWHDNLKKPVAKSVNKMHL